MSSLRNTVTSIRFFYARAHRCLQPRDIRFHWNNLKFFISSLYRIRISLSTSYTRINFTQWMNNVPCPKIQLENRFFNEYFIIDVISFMVYRRFTRFGFLLFFHICTTTYKSILRLRATDMIAERVGAKEANDRSFCDFLCF